MTTTRTFPSFPHYFLFPFPSFPSIVGFHSRRRHKCRRAWSTYRYPLRANWRTLGLCCAQMGAAGLSLLPALHRVHGHFDIISGPFCTLFSSAVPPPPRCTKPTAMYHPHCALPSPPRCSQALYHPHPLYHPLRCTTPTALYHSHRAVCDPML